MSKASQFLTTLVSHASRGKWQPPVQPQGANPHARPEAMPPGPEPYQGLPFGRFQPALDGFNGGFEAPQQWRSHLSAWNGRGWRRDGAAEAPAARRRSSGGLFSPRASTAALGGLLGPRGFGGGQI